MTGKGSFWKNNIKNLKKENKKRRIQQKVKLSRMKIEKTVSNELQFVVTNNEKKQQQKLQELLEISQEPIEYYKILLDTNIISDIFLAEDDIVARINNYFEKKSLSGNDISFLTLDRVIMEFIHMKKHCYAEEYTPLQVYGELSSLRRFQVDKLDTRAEYAHSAEELYDSKKYYGSDGVPLSLVDCYLLEYAIEHSCKLATRDNALIDATKKEIRLRFDESELTGATSPDVFNPNRI